MLTQLSLEEVLSHLNSEVAQVQLASKSALGSFPSVSIDSRTLLPGQCFLALRGERFDGNLFVDQALKKGASIVFSEAPCPVGESWPDRSLVRIQSGEVVLWKLAELIRNKWPGRVFAITGSMGKTTTRHFLGSLLSNSFDVHESPGNWNNHIGVPLSILALEDRHQVAVLELGMSHSGEIERLSQLCHPQIATLTNVAPVHLENFSGLDEIAEAKAEIIKHLDPNGALVYNQSDPFVDKVSNRFPGSKISFGWAPNATVRILDYEILTIDRMRVRLEVAGQILKSILPFSGKTLLENVAAATATAFAAGLDADKIGTALEELRPLSMRGQILHQKSDCRPSITIWDDSYNSSPVALQSTLETLKQIMAPRVKVLVLGDMLELGEDARRLHRQSGRAIAETSCSLLITVGNLSEEIAKGAAQAGFAGQSVHARSPAEAFEILNHELKGGELVFIKGSRSVGLDLLVRKLVKSQEKV